MKNTFDEKDLISFSTYVLKERREEILKNPGYVATHNDYEAWFRTVIDKTLTPVAAMQG